ncbi:MAG: acyl-CoA dehydrogenase family protein, partial [Chloroflexi bacterium]|nr:acyl-CoA dehydrogenase family protein [Chloroflexota bacterium]
LIHHGTVEQKQRYIQNILTADEIWCQLFSEPGSGSDLASLRTRADIRDGHFVVNGQKVWTSLGYAADWGVLLARTDANVPKYNGISYILLDMHSPGVEVRPLKQITGSAEFCEVFFTDVRAPRENLIGQLNQGWQIAQTTLSYERGGSLLGRVVRAQVLFAQLVKTVKRMEEQGVLADHDPLVRQKLGRICVDMEVLRYNGLRILSRHQKGNRPGPESSIDKLYRSEFDQRFQALAQEILGPYGQLSDGLPPEFVDDGDDQRRVETWAFRFLASKAGTIAAGTSEVQRNIIGERVLGLPKEPRADRVKK